MDSMKYKQKGQILLIVVLIMVVSLTVGLSVISRSITNLKISTEEADSAKALSAAEAGIQRQLQSSTGLSSTFSNNTSYTTDIAAVGGTSILLNGGNLVPQDEGVDLWLVPHNGNNPDYTKPWSPSGPSNLTIYWGNTSGNCNNPNNVPAALEIIVISGTQTSQTLTRYAYDPCITRANSNRFSSTSGSGTAGGKSFPYSATISVTSGLIARVIPIYTNTYIGASSTTTAFYSQGSMISSIGTSGTSGNIVTRKVNVFQSFPQLPAEYFTYGIFSPR